MTSRSLVGEFAPHGRSRARAAGDGPHCPWAFARSHGQGLVHAPRGARGRTGALEARPGVGPLAITADVVVLDRRGGGSLGHVGFSTVLNICKTVEHRSSAPPSPAGTRGVLLVHDVSSHDDRLDQLLPEEPRHGGGSCARSTTLRPAGPAARARLRRAPAQGTSRSSRRRLSLPAASASWAASSSSWWRSSTPAAPTAHGTE